MAFNRYYSLVKQVFKTRTFHSFQIEVTSRCNHSCLICPRNQVQAFKGTDLSFEVFTKIAQYFKTVRAVHLQGWGEPLLHQDFFSMLKLAKGNGCAVSFTTNGSLLNPFVSKKIIEIGVDRIGISLAGVSSSVHEKIRQGSNLHKLLENLKSLHQLKREKKSLKPHVILSFMLMKSNQHQLEKIPYLAKENGIQEVVITNLDYVNSRDLHGERAFLWEGDPVETRKLLEETAVKAKELKIGWRSYSLSLHELPICELNPLNMLFVSSQGQISPCIYLTPMGPSPIKRFFCERVMTMEPVVFGHLTSCDLMSIWQSKEYREFRMKYQRRWNMLNQVIHGAFEEMKVERFINQYQEVLQEYPLPLVCKTCYKAYDI